MCACMHVWVCLCGMCVYIFTQGQAMVPARTYFILLKMGTGHSEIETSMTVRLCGKIGSSPIMSHM